MKKILVLFLLTGCELFNIGQKSETKNTPKLNAPEKSEVNSPIVEGKSAKVQKVVLSQKELNDQWIQNLKSKENRYADGNGGAKALANIAADGSFSTINVHSKISKNFHFIKAISSTEAHYWFSYSHDGNVIYAVLKIVESQNPGSFSEIVEQIHTTKDFSVNPHSPTTDLFFRAP